MRFTRRTLTTLIFLIPLALLAYWSIFAVRKYYAGAERDLAPILETEATRALGHEVKVGAVTIRGRYAYVDNVRLAEGKTIAERGTIVTARQVILDLDLRKILLTRTLPSPLFAHVQVLDPVGQVSRNSAGRWNFEDLFKPPPGPPTPSPVGQLTITNGILSYSDSALPRNPKRPNIPFVTRFQQVNGEMLFNADHSVNWDFRVAGTPGAVQTARAMGSYEPPPYRPVPTGQAPASSPPGRLYVRVDAVGLALPLANRFLPPDATLTGGLASGRITLLQDPTLTGRFPFDYQANLNFVGATVTSPRLREPVQNIAGATTIARDMATVKVDAGFAGSRLHTEGTVLNFEKPALNGWATGDNVQVQRLLAALDIPRKYPALRQFAQVSATANVRADVRGTLQNLDVRATGPATVRGSLPNGAALPESGTLQVAFTGPLAAPRIHLSGTLPRVRYRDYEAQNARLFARVQGPFDSPKVLVSGTVQRLRAASLPGLDGRNFTLSGVYTPTRAGVDFAGQAAGGTIAGRANVQPNLQNSRQTAYQVITRARKVNLAALPRNWFVLKNGKDKRQTLVVRGVVSADVTAQGRLDGKLPLARAEVQGTGLKLDKWTLQQARARFRSAGDTVTIETLAARDSKGVVVAHGSVDLKRRSLALSLDADRLDLGAISDAIQNPKSQIQNAFSGLAYLRQGRVEGTFEDPRLVGKIYGYGFNADALPEGTAPDYVAAEVTATRDVVTIQSGHIYRFPAVADVSGQILRPLSESPTLALSGEFRGVEMLDALAIATNGAKNEIALSGTARGPFTVGGTIQRPELHIPQIAVADARVGPFDFTSVTAGLRYDPEEDGGTIHLDNFTALRPRTNAAITTPGDQTTITGNAALNRDKQFRLSARAFNIDLDLVEPYLSEFVTVAGTGEIAVEGLRGELKAGKAENLRGQLTARTSGLTVNGVSLGDLHGQGMGQAAVFTLNDDTVTSNEFQIGTSESGVYLAPTEPGLPAFRYSRGDDTLRATGEMRGVAIENLRQAMAKSPYLSLHPESVVTNYLKPGLAPLEGTLNGNFLVTGTSKNPTTDFTWYSDKARIEGQDIQTFEGRVVFDHENIRISGRNGETDATLRADDTVVNAHGVINNLADAGPNRTVNADLDVNNLPLRLLDRWFPARPILKDLDGSADSIQLEARGRLDNPSLVMSVLVRNITWIETQEIPLAGTTAQPAPPTPAVPAGTAGPPAPTNQKVIVRRHDYMGKPIDVETTGREYRIRRAEVARVTVNDPMSPNLIRMEKIRLKLQDQAQAPTIKPNSPQTSPTGPAKGGKQDNSKKGQPTEQVVPSAPILGDRPTYDVYADGEIAFDWQDMDFSKDRRVNFEIHVPPQKLAMLKALVPTTPESAAADLETQTDLDGTVFATLLWKNTLKDPDIDGTVYVTADHIRYRNMTTQVKDLIADIKFNGDTLKVNNFTAKTQVLNPRTLEPISTSEPIVLTGELPLTEQSTFTPTIQVWPPRINGPTLHLTADRIRVAEAPLPGLKSGGLITDNLATDLTIGGALTKPFIRGVVNLDQASFRMPDDFLLGTGSGKAFIQPAFDLAFNVGENVRISSAQIAATVRTEVGAPVTLRGALGAREPINLNGNLIVEKGTINIAQYRFVLQRGGLVSLRYPSYTFGNFTDPTLGLIANVTATTHLTATSVNGQRKRYTITADVRGPINSGAPLRLGDAENVGVGLFGERGLQITFKSDPADLSLTSGNLQTKIAGLLGGQEAIQDIFSRNSDVGRLLRTQLTDALSNRFFPELFERLGIGEALGFEEFTLDVNQLNAFTLHLSRQLIGPLYASYSRRLSGGAGTSEIDRASWEFKLSYRFPFNVFRSNLQFSYSIDDQKTNAYLLEGVFKF